MLQGRNVQKVTEYSLCTEDDKSLQYYSQKNVHIHSHEKRIRKTHRLSCKRVPVTLRLFL